MLSKPWAGWTTVNLNNETLGDASYLDWIPGLILEPCIRYLKLCKESIEKYGYTSGGYGLNIQFDAEGHYFGIVEIGNDLFTFDTLGKVEPYINLKEIDLSSHDYENYKFIYNLVNEVIDDIESNYEDWILWDVMTNKEEYEEEYKEEYKNSKESLDKILKEAKETINELDNVNNIPHMELGNILFGNSRGSYPVPRDEWQDKFCEFLDECGFDTYGYINDDTLEKEYGIIIEGEGIVTLKNGESYKEHQQGFDNGIFRILPYYWGESENICKLSNFIYYPENYEIQWYKYPLRDSWSNKEITFEEFCDILDKCKESLKNK